MWGVGSTPAMGTGSTVANITTLTKIYGPRTGFKYSAVCYGFGCVRGAVAPCRAECASSAVAESPVPSDPRGLAPHFPGAPSARSTPVALATAGAFCSHSLFVKGRKMGAYVTGSAGILLIAQPRSSNTPLLRLTTQGHRERRPAGRRPRRKSAAQPGADHPNRNRRQHLGQPGHGRAPHLRRQDLDALPFHRRLRRAHRARHLQCCPRLRIPHLHPDSAHQPVGGGPLLIRRDLRQHCGRVGEVW